MYKKTNFPDLEISPPHNHFKHFLDWLWNKPRWVFSDFYEKISLKKKIEINNLKIELEIKKMELLLLKNQIKDTNRTIKNSNKIN